MIPITIVQADRQLPVRPLHEFDEIALHTQ